MANPIKVPEKVCRTSLFQSMLLAEAKRIARGLIRDEIKAQNLEVTYFEMREITEAVNELINKEPDILIQAKANLIKEIEDATL